jgi:hypothetical protein
MEMSGQFHDPAALPPWKDPRYTLDRRWSDPQSRCGRGGENKNSQLPQGNEPQNSDRPARKLVTMTELSRLLPHMCIVVSGFIIILTVINPLADDSDRCRRSTHSGNVSNFYSCKVTEWSQNN